MKGYESIVIFCFGILVKFKKNQYNNFLEKRSIDKILAKSLSLRLYILSQLNIERWDRLRVLGVGEAD